MSLWHLSILTLHGQGSNADLGGNRWWCCQLCQLPRPPASPCKGCELLSQGQMEQNFRSNAFSFVAVLLQQDGIRWGYPGSSHPWNNSRLPEEEPLDTLCTSISKVSFTKKKKVRNISLKGWLGPEQRVVESRFLLQPLPWSQHLAMWQTPTAAPGNGCLRRTKKTQDKSRTLL